MRNRLLFSAVLLVIGILGGDLTSAAGAQERPQPTVKIVDLPHIVLPQRPTASPEEEVRIKSLIADLAKIERPDFGLSATMSGSAFAPVPGSAHGSAFVIGDHGMQTTSAFLQLVKLGPRAMPLLLAALDDNTPTQLTMKREGILTWMEYGQELWGNPGNSVEQAALAEIPRDSRRDPGEGPEKHTVTIGDVCFVIIGQIVGRSYAAVRYQPTGGLMINSPTHDPLLARLVRKIWSAPNPEQHLLDALLLDYASHGMHRKPKDDLGEWYVGSELQVAAAMRLLYYFPQQTPPLLAKRLRNLKVNDVTEPDNNRWPNKWVYREVANGARTDELIKATAWCTQPEIRSALGDLFLKTEDPEIAVACLSAQAVVDKKTIRRKLAPLLRRHADDMGPFGNAYHLLISMGRFGDGDVKADFQAFLRQRRVVRARAMIHALREVRPEWAVELLSPFLTDKRTFEWSYAVNPNKNEPRLPIRICDEAAETLAGIDRNLRFRMEGSHANLDQQIRGLRAQIQAKQRH